MKVIASNPNTRRYIVETMFGDDEDIRSDRDLAYDYRQEVARQERLIEVMQIDMDTKHAEIVRLRVQVEQLQKTVEGLSVDLPPTVHWRKCHDCGTIQLHADNRTSYVLCRKCGSQDTRKVSNGPA